MQKIAFDALDGERGAILLIDAQSGEVITLASSPSFNLNNFIKGEDVKKFLVNRDKPMINRVIQATYPLGSTIKPILAAAALEEIKISPERTFECSGEMRLGDARFRCWAPHGKENLYEGLTHSCNVYFYNLGLILGADLMAKWAKIFGLESLTEIDLPYEKTGFVPTPLWKSKALRQRWFPGDTLNLAIGQGYIETTPLELLAAINAFANGGYRLRSI